MRASAQRTQTVSKTGEGIRTSTSDSRLEGILCRMKRSGLRRLEPFIEGDERLRFAVFRELLEEVRERAG